MSKISVYLTVCSSLLLLILATPVARANMPERSSIKADITHPFIVGNTTLPPGKYDLRMLTDTNQKVMRIATPSGSTSVEFLVRTSIDNHRPTHTELVFNRYGKAEILKDIYAAGQKTGVAVLSPSREEARLQKSGQKPDPHTEIQNQ